MSAPIGALASIKRESRPPGEGDRLPNIYLAGSDNDNNSPLLQRQHLVDRHRVPDHRASLLAYLVWGAR